MTSARRPSTNTSAPSPTRRATTNGVPYRPTTSARERHQAGHGHGAEHRHARSGEQQPATPPVDGGQRRRRPGGSPAGAGSARGPARAGRHPDRGRSRRRPAGRGRPARPAAEPAGPGPSAPQRSVASPISSTRSRCPSSSCASSASGVSQAHERPRAVVLEHVAARRPRTSSEPLQRPARPQPRLARRWAPQAGPADRRLLDDQADARRAPRWCAPPPMGRIAPRPPGRQSPSSMRIPGVQRHRAHQPAAVDERAIAGAAVLEGGRAGVDVDPGVGRGRRSGPPAAGRWRGPARWPAAGRAATARRPGSTRSRCGRIDPARGVPQERHRASIRGSWRRQTEHSILRGNGGRLEDGHARGAKAGGSV